MTTDTDRRVHVIIVPRTGGPHIRIVRYERAGKWYYESDGVRRQLILAEAAAFAEDRPSVHWYEGRLGGKMFDAKVRQLRAAAAKK